MAQVTVNEEALRELVREALDGGHLGNMVGPEDDEPVNVNPVVDPSAAFTDPINPDFVPQTKPELDVALHKLSQDVPIDKVPSFYKTLRDVIDTENAQTEEDEEMKKAAQGGTEQVEEAVRRAVRKMLNTMTEASPLPPVKKIPPGVHGAEYMSRVQKSRDDLAASLGRSRFSDPGDDDADVDDDEPKKRAYKSTAIGGMDDVGGSSFEAIAKTLADDLKAEADAEIAAAEASGDEDAVRAAKQKKVTSSVAGAKRVADEALTKARFLATLDNDDREIMILTAMNDYIGQLRKSGELSPADVQLMKDHPQIVGELPGFREFLHTVVRRAMKGDVKLTDPLGEHRRRLREAMANVGMDLKEAVWPPLPDSEQFRVLKKVARGGSFDPEEAKTAIRILRRRGYLTVDDARAFNAAVMGEKQPGLNAILTTRRSKRDKF